jgi:hypothetical protein
MGGDFKIKWGVEAKIWNYSSQIHHFSSQKNNKNKKLSILCFENLKILFSKGINNTEKKLGHSEAKGLIHLQIEPTMQKIALASNIF